MTKSISLPRKCIAEFIGTFAIAFLGCGASMVNERFPGMLLPTSIPIVFGSTVAAMIYAVGHISGAHFNPAVSFAFMVGRHFPIRHLWGYWVAQFLGAFAAIGVLFVTLPLGNVYGSTIPNVVPISALVWESVLSFFLMFVIVSVATDTRAIGTMAGAAIGATVTIAAYVGGPVTGASMNPARTLAPALMQGTLPTFWIYSLGPLLGTSFAAIIYKFIRSGERH